MSERLRAALPLVAAAAAVLAVQAGLVIAGAWWAKAAAVAARTPEELAAGRALSATALFLGPWTPFAAALAGALQARSAEQLTPGAGRGGTRDVPAPSPEGLRAAFRESGGAALMALAVVAGEIAGIAALRRAWSVAPGAPPDPARAAIFFGSIALAASGVFVLARRFASPEGSFLAVSGLIALLTGSVFFADGWIEGAPQGERADRIDLAIGANPLLAGAGEVAGTDLLRTRGLYGASVIGPYYPYRYPELDASRNRYLAVMAAAFGGALAVGGLRLLVRRLLPRRA